MRASLWLMDWNRCNGPNMTPNRGEPGHLNDFTARYAYTPPTVMVACHVPLSIRLMKYV